MLPLHYKNFEVRLAITPDEVDASQALRYQVFYDELGAVPTPEMRRTRRDFDDFDPICDHLLVIDRNKSNGLPKVAGTYRMLRKSAAEKAQGFYSAQEFDISALNNYPGEILELGRTCVHTDYRKCAVMQLLWRGISEYAGEHKCGVMFGCASFYGTTPESLRAPLSYLYHKHLAPDQLRARALENRYVDMSSPAAEDVDEAEAMAALPPLLKGYMRVGGFVGDGAVVDRQFNTTDVCIIVETRKMAEKYKRHYKEFKRV
ncbi:MAG: GNAT family N-acetyltransferase [Rhodospirillales bacterium]